MWVFPLVAAVVAFVFAGTLARRYASRRQSYQLAWALSLGMYGLASLMAVLGVVNGWTSTEFAAYWALGAVLNVPFLAGGEVMLLARRTTVDLLTWLVLIFIVAYTVAVLRNADLAAAALLERLPSGKDVFGDGSPAHRLPQLISIPSYLVLIGGDPVVRVDDARTAGPARPLRGDVVDRDRRHDRGRGRHVRRLREPPGILRHAGGRHRGDVRRLLARVTSVIATHAGDPPRKPLAARRASLRIVVGEWVRSTRLVDREAEPYVRPRREEGRRTGLPGSSRGPARRTSRTDPSVPAC